MTWRSGRADSVWEGFSCRCFVWLCVHMAWLSGQRRDPFLLNVCPFCRAWHPSLESLWHRVFPISATSLFSLSFWGSGITLVYQLFEAFSRIGFYDCALELAGATGIVERRMAMSNAQSLGRWQGTFLYFFLHQCIFAVGSGGDSEEGLVLG